MAILEELTTAGEELAAARRTLEDAKTAAKKVVIAARADGVYEHIIAATLGVDRMTVRHWLGK